MASTKTSTSSSCRTCNQRRVHTWCQNTKCDEYAGKLHPCSVPMCTGWTAQTKVLCRTHFAKGGHCSRCAQRLNEESLCLDCDTYTSCVVDDCHSHVKAFKGDLSQTIPLCQEHWGTRLCREHTRPLVDGVCTFCDNGQCAVEDCKNPTRLGQSLCPSHYRQNEHCFCGKALSGLGELKPFCETCDEHWKCASKKCNRQIACRDYCYACHQAYIAKTR